MSSMTINYGVPYVFRAPLLDFSGSEFASVVDWTYKIGDVKVSKDGGAAVNIATTPTFIPGMNIVSFTITADEAKCDELVIQVIDTAAVKGIQDHAFRLVTSRSSSLLVGQSMSSGSNTLMLDGDSPNVDGFFVGQRIVMTDGNGVNQVRIITAQNGRLVTVSPGWTAIPAAGSSYEIQPFGIVPGLTASQVENAVDTVITNYGVSTAAQVAAVTNSVGTTSQIATAVWNLPNAIETGITPLGALRVIGAGVAGKRSGIGTGTERYAAINNDGKVRITMSFPSTVDANTTTVVTDAS
jgi:hypothetical protein